MKAPGLLITALLLREGAGCPSRRLPSCQGGKNRKRRPAHAGPLYLRVYTRRGGGGGIALGNWREGAGEDAGSRTDGHHPPPRALLRLTTSLGRLSKSGNGDSQVLVSTLSITTSSRDLLLTLCFKTRNDQRNSSGVSVLPKATELRRVEKRIVRHESGGAGGGRNKGKSYIIKECKQLRCMRKNRSYPTIRKGWVENASPACLRISTH